MHNNKPMTNAADPKQVRAAKKKDKDRAQQSKKDLRFILSDPRGRRFLWEVLGYCGAYRSVFNTNSLLTHYNSGRQDVGHWLMEKVVSVDENNYFTMVKENSELGKGHS